MLDIRFRRQLRPLRMCACFVAKFVRTGIAERKIQKLSYYLIDYQTVLGDV